jgi:purine-cytosine permease-like protein
MHPLGGCGGLLFSLILWIACTGFSGIASHEAVGMEKCQITYISVSNMICVSLLLASQSYSPASL